MKVCEGIPVSPGIAFCQAFVLRSLDEGSVIPRSIQKDGIETEVQRYKDAVKKASARLDKELNKLEEQDEISRQILGSHRNMVADPVFAKEVAKCIQEQYVKAESAVHIVMAGYLKRFESMEAAYISERVHDLHDMKRNLLEALGKSVSRNLSSFESEVIVIGHNLTPTETTSMDKGKVRGFAIEVGGRTSHTAIIARALRLPAVVGVKGITRDVRDGDTVIIDGYSGEVIINPDEATLKTYKARAEVADTYYRELVSDVGLPAQTIDGYPIRISANIELPDEIHTAMEWGAEGVGLYRTEFLYDGKELPDEETQFKSYKSALSLVGDHPLVFRLMDLGADKLTLPGFDHEEQNPFLGCRSLRLVNEYPEMFRTQIRAILRASHFGNAKLMLPMIAQLEEVQRFKKLIIEAQRELDKEEIPYNPDLEVGIMVEVPAAALSASQLAREAQFFSIGTNDLIQYTVAVDRVNERVAHLYQPCHPAVLRLIKMIIEEAGKSQIPVSICGEMCSEPAYAILLMGLGLRNFSVSPVAIPMIKKVIRQITMKQARETAQDCLKFKTADECQSFLNVKTRRWLPNPW